jgi:hypothetical protein
MSHAWEACVAVSIVNGYVCYSGCDASKARTGQDPHPKTDSSQPGAATSPTAGGVQNPAVTYGGALANRTAVAPPAASPPAGATGTPPPNLVDRYA